MEFVDRLLLCADCGGEFVFTAGEQLFFFDKQFKNDPKRCKGCKSKRSGTGQTCWPQVPQTSTTTTATSDADSRCFVG